LVQDGFYQTISQHLELKPEDSTFPFAFFDNIGSLDMLETFILDARHVGAMTADGPKPNTPMDDNCEEHGAADVGHWHSNTYRPPICSFNQLTVLHLIGWLPLLDGLIRCVTSTKLEDVSVTLIRLSYDETK
jgi:hypothetical protein